MPTTTATAEIPECQHCHAPVTWSGRPADAGYGAMTHNATNTVACPVQS